MNNNARQDALDLPEVRLGIELSRKKQDLELARKRRTNTSVKSLFKFHSMNVCDSSDKIRNFSVTSEEKLQWAKIPHAIMEDMPTHQPIRVVEKDKTASASSNSEEDNENTAMKTGEDSLHYFAKYGQSSAIKFVHLVRKPCVNDFRPYDLVIVDAVPTDSDYFTMTPRGVVHVMPGELSDCCTLSEWMRDSSIYNVLRTIPFYKLYLSRKCFQGWLKSIREIQFQRQREKAMQLLFLGKQNFAQSVVDLKAKVSDFRETSLIDSETKTATLQQLVELYSSRQQDTAMKLDEAIGEINSGLDRVIHKVKSTATAAQIACENVENAAVGESLDEDSTMDALQMQKRSRSIVELKYEKRRRRAVAERTRQELDMLPSYIRLCDWVILEALIGMSIRTAETYYYELSRGRKSGVVEISTSFTSKDTSFAPSCIEVQTSLNCAIVGLVNAIGDVSRLSLLPPFAGNAAILLHISPELQEITEEASQGSPSATQMILVSPRFTSACSSIKQKIAQDFEKAVEHAQSYEPARAIQEFNATWDLRTFRSQSPNASSLRHLMETIAGWGKELDKLRNKPVGMLEVDCKKLRTNLQVIKESRFDEVRDYIKDRARQECVEQLSVCSRAYDEISNEKVTNVTQLTIDHWKPREKEIMRSFGQVNQLYKTLESFNVSISSQDSVLHDTLTERFSQFKGTLENLIRILKSEAKEEA